MGRKRFEPHHPGEPCIAKGRVCRGARVCEIHTPSRSLIRLSDSKQSLSQSGVEMTANTVRRFRTAIMIMMVCIPISLSYGYIDTGVISVIGLVIGIALSMPL